MSGANPNAGLGFKSLRTDFALNPSMSQAALANSIQNAINACISAGYSLDVGADVWQFDGSPLTVGANLKIRGAGAKWVMSTVANSDGTQVPGAAPWYQGGGLIQTAAGADLFDISATAATLDLEDIVVGFDGAAAFNNTGWIVNAVPTASDGSGGVQNGMFSPFWKNVHFFGADGNHGPMQITNINQGNMIGIRAVGGGGGLLACNSGVSSFGNSRFFNGYFAMICGGTSDGWAHNSPTSGFPGSLNLLTYIAWQLNIINVTGKPIASAYTITPPVTTQHRWNDLAGVGVPQNVLVVAPDLEAPSSVGNYGAVFGIGTQVITGGGIFVGGGGAGSVAYQARKARQSVPTVAAGGGAGSGSGGTAAMHNGGSGASQAAYNDERGQVNITTGTAPGAANSNAVCTVTYGEPWPVGAPGAVIIAPVYPPVGSAIQWYAKNVTATSFDVWANQQLAASTSYSFHYHVVE